MAKIIIIGANGRMGKLASTILAESHIIIPCTKQDNLPALINHTQPDLALELSGAKSVMQNSITPMGGGARIRRYERYSF